MQMRILYNQVGRELQKRPELKISTINDIVCRLENELCLTQKIIDKELESTNNLINLLSNDESNKLELSKLKLKIELIKHSKQLFEKTREEFNDSKEFITSLNVTIPNGEKSHKLGYLIWDFEVIICYYSRLDFKNKLIVKIENEILCH